MSSSIDSEVILQAIKEASNEIKESYEELIAEVRKMKEELREDRKKNS